MIDQRPNIVFLFADDQRFDTLRALGNTDIHTPHLDNLLEHGTAFRQAHIPGGTVGAVCMPSRAMLHTGRTLFHIHDDGRSIPEEHVLMGETFRQAGYATFGIGKWHNGAASFNRSFSDGEDIFFGGMEDHWNVPAFRYHADGSYSGKIPVIRDRLMSNEVEYRPADKIQAGVHSTDLFSDTAVQWIHQYKEEEEPFFLYVSYMAPHDPRSMPEKYMQLYDPASLTLPDNVACEHAFDYGIRDIRDERLAAYPRTEEEIRGHLAEYYAMITHLDDRIGDIIHALKETELFDHTIIVFTGDNGLAVGQHGLMGKQSCYEHSVRVPLIFSGPGIPKGQRRDEFVYLSDIYPTLCELTQVPIPSSVEGASLAPLFSRVGAISDRDRLYFAYADLVRAVKSREYKLIVYHHKSQLFRVSEDPLERYNLIEDPAFSHMEQVLMKELIEHSYRSGDRKHPAGQQFWSQFDRHQQGEDEQL
ncbi:sulfatase-like hydrolase/transferase [Paenibacillus soyae]|uniref:Sulfatase-like hydrolase/transferase n=1 Tax=Paenibacillus soyae TaxID=2969249 RepID=A0A9X2SBF5_9BACL|nr:sulfatase-like hydrolase/transferase [Paenibacillus soyae]MCR2804787.1 sulfatase-like hydrolase/transferase [Paenibacillus soyae]